MTPKQKRVAWIAGLAAGGLALAGGIAYAASKSSGGGGGTSGGGGTTGTQNTPSPSHGTFPSPIHISLPPVGFTTPAPTPPAMQQVNVTEGTSSYAVQAVANGLLTIYTPSGTKIVSADPDGTGTVLTLNPTSVQVGLNGSHGTVTINFEDLNTIAQYTVSVTVS